MGDERFRLFCALQLPDETLAALTAWQERHLSAGRIVPPANLHVTLAFLGSRPAGEVGAITRELAEAAAAARPARFRTVRYRETRSVGLAERFRQRATLNEPNPATFYGGGAEGYTDYPTLP